MNNDRQVDTFEAEINQLLIDIEQIKQKQLLGGDSWIFYRLITANTWDIQLASLPINTQAMFRVRFLPDTDELTAATFLVSSIFTGSITVRQMPVAGIPHCWDFYYKALSVGVTYSAKLLIKSTQNGTISVVRTI